jgi:hypothetical protein
MLHTGRECVGQLDYAGRGRVLHVSLASLPCGRLVDDRVVLANRTVAAHEVDVFVAIAIPYAGALGARRELRIVGRRP